MKKVLTMLLVASIFGLVACNQSADEQAGAEAEAVEAVEDAVEAVEEEAVEAVEETTEELADHVCPNDRCTDEACHYLHGEKGHECGDDCHSEDDGHDHGDDAEEGADATEEG
ncbi:MAG TPA: hypothetical protein EYN71_02540 [Flavobacteriales bacterium]|nr:hypothetical protein [Flavobacteriales bacterium]